MDKVKKVYVDSRLRTNDSDSNDDLKFELIEALQLPDNAVCYVDDISSPHTWRTTEAYNDTFCIILKTTVITYNSTETYNWLCFHYPRR